MDFHKILVYVVTGCLLVVYKVHALLNQTYGDITFILSNISADNSQGQTSLTAAQNWCQSKGYTLAKIRDERVQNYVQQFISTATSSGETINQIILNGKLKSDLTGTWTWVNGQQRKDGINIHDQRDLSQGYFYGYLKTSDFEIHASTHNNGRPYICETPGNDDGCVGGQSLNGRCYQRKTNSLNWYRARNDCVEGGGDLASFETLGDDTFRSAVGSQLLANVSTTEYWVGLQRVEWRWEDTGLPIKYTKWEDGSPSNKPTEDCLSLRLTTTPEWLWYNYGCSETYRFICMASNRTTPVPTIPTSSSAFAMDASSTKSTSESVIPAPTSPSFSVQPASHISPTNDSRLALALGLGIGLGVGAILVVVIVLGVIFIRRRQKNKSNHNLEPTSSGDAAVPKGLKESDIDAEIENNGTNKYGASTGNPGAIYATVQSSGTLLPPTNHEKTDGKQVIYADFDLVQKP